MTLVRVELLKLRTMRLTYGLLAAGAGVTALFTYLQASNSGGRVPSIATPAGLRDVTTASGMSLVFAAILGVIVATGEFRHTTATLTYLATPDRRRVLIAKIAAAAVAGLRLRARRRICGHRRRAVLCRRARRPRDDRYAGRRRTYRWGGGRRGLVALPRGGRRLIDPIRIGRRHRRPDVVPGIGIDRWRRCHRRPPLPALHSCKHTGRHQTWSGRFRARLQRLRPNRAPFRRGRRLSGGHRRGGLRYLEPCHHLARCDVTLSPHLPPASLYHSRHPSIGDAAHQSRCRRRSSDRYPELFIMQTEDPLMYKTAVRAMIRRGVRSLQGGDTAPILAAYADDAVLLFPGQSSWGGEYRGKAAIAEFLHRFVETGLVGEVHDILVNGPPWRTTVCVLFTDRATDEGGRLVYQNRAVLLARIVWGKIIYQEDFEDTHKVEAFDNYLAARGTGR
jgi:ketosteroid isomerase-like protein